MPTPVEFINRVREMNSLLMALRAWDTRQAVFVQGSGGVGKTRLLAEVYRRLEGLLQPLTSRAAEERPITLGVLTPYRQSAWEQEFMAGCMDMAETLGVQLALGENECSYSPEKTLQEFDQLVHRQPQAFILDLASGAALVDPVQQARQAGIPVVMVSSDPRIPHDARIELDERGLAYESLRALLHEVAEGEQIAVASGPEAPFTLAYRQVLDEMRAGRSFIELQLGPEDSPESEAILAMHKIKAIWALDGETGVSVYNLLKAYNLSHIPIYAIGLNDPVRECMVEPGSAWKASVASDPKEIGRIAVRVAVSLAYGDPVLPYYTAPYGRVTQPYLRTLPAQQPLDENNIPGWGSKMAWTPWLYQLQERHQAADRPAVRFCPALYHQDAGHDGQTYLILKTLDLDDIRLQTAQDVALALINQLDPDDFQIYRDQLARLNDLAEQRQEQEKQRQVTEEIFIECLNKCSAGRRIILSCDTAEVTPITSAQEQEALAYLLRLVSELRNAALIVSGRNAENLYNRHSLAGVTKSLIVLEPFDTAAGEEYLLRKSKLLHMRPLEAELNDKVRHLSAGMPIVMDLAMESLARRVDLGWLITEKLSDLEGLAPESLKERREKFEKQLVEKIVQLRGDDDRLIVALAWVYPMSVDLCAEVFGLDREKAQALIEESQNLTFIKPLANGEIKLHDYMFDMVQAHIVPQIDEKRKAYYCQGAMRYYQRRLAEQTAEVAQTPDLPFFQREMRQREYWQTGRQYLRYARAAGDQELSFDIFCRLFDAAKEAYGFVARDGYVQQIQPLPDPFPQKWLYPIYSRLSEHLVDLGKYSQARPQVETLLSQPNLLPSQRLGALSRWANISLNLGQINQAIDEFKQALELCEATPDLRPWKSQILNGMGYANRFAGRLKEAETCYIQALENEPRDNQIANIYNNLGYVLFLQGSYDEALEYCRQAQKLSEELHLEREIGMILLTLGDIQRNQGKYPEALDHYNQAIQIFEKPNDVSWLARAYSRRGATYRLMRMYEQAKSDLNRSLNFKIKLEMPFTHHVLGCVYFDESWEKGRRTGKTIDLNSLEEALKQFRISDQSAEGIDSQHNPVNNLVTSAEVYYTQWIETGKQNDDLPRKIDAVAQQVMQLINERLLHQRGRLYRVLGDVAFEQKAYDQALEYYVSAYPDLASRFAGYGRYNFDQEFQNLEGRIQQLGQQDQPLAQGWLHCLREKWGKSDTPNRDKLLLKLQFASQEFRRKFKA